MAGLTAARHLTQHGHYVQVLDKGRGPGGRLATRRLGERRVDHGAQFFTVRSDEFARAAATWEAAGITRPWFTHDGHTRYGGVDGMNAIARYLAAGLDVRCGMQVKTITAGVRWEVTATTGETFAADALVVTAPAEQSRALLGPLAPPLLSEIEFDPCFALLIAGDGESLVPAPGYLRPTDSPFAWVADNAQKGISPSLALTFHASPAFSRAHFDDAPRAEQELRQAARHYYHGEPEHIQIHRWRYSQPVNALPQACFFTSHPLPLAIAGDAFAGPRVEGAFLSGLAAASALLGTAR
jgi:renalase